MNFQVYKITKPDNYIISIEIDDTYSKDRLIYAQKIGGINYGLDAINSCLEIVDSQDLQLDEMNNIHDLNKTNAEYIFMGEYVNLEHELLKLVISKLNELKLNKNTNLVIEIGNIYTTPTIEFIFLLSCFFENTYVHKPLSSSPLKDNKFLILKNMIEQIPKIHNSGELYYNKFVEKTNDIFEREILCINKALYKAKFECMEKIAKLCNTKTCTELILTQCKNKMLENTNNYKTMLENKINVDNDYVCKNF